MKKTKRRRKKDEESISLKTGWREVKVIHRCEQSLFCCETNILFKINKYTVLDKAAGVCIVYLLELFR